MKTVRQVDKMRYLPGCVLTQADMRDVPKGTSAQDLLNWLDESRRVVNTYIIGKQRLP